MNSKQPFTVILISILLIANLGKVKAQCPGIYFTVNDSNSCINQILTYKAFNVPAQTKYTWYLGQDTILGNNLDTVKIGYISEGTYDISLKLEFKNGGGCHIIKNKFVTVNQLPDKPTVNIDKTNLCNIDEVATFSNNQKNISSYDWTIGQILYSDTGNTIQHKFIRNGYFSVGITVRDFNGCQNSARYDSVILVERPPIVKTELKDTAVCDSFTLFLRPTYNLYGQDNFKFDWQTTGGNPNGSGLKYPSKIYYGKSGTYGINLTLISEGNCKFEYPFKDSIRIGKSVEFKVTKNISAPCNTQTVDYEISNQSSLIGNLKWDFFGDSISYSVVNNVAKVTYKKSGLYKYTISHNDNGCLSTYEDSNLINTFQLQARFNLDHYCNCNFPDTIVLSNNSIIKNPNEAKYKWEVSNQNNEIIATSTLKNPKIAITKAGIYSLKLQVEDASGCIDTLVKHNYYRNEPIKLGISAKPKIACVNTDVLFEIDSACTHTFKEAIWYFYNDKGEQIAKSTDDAPIQKFSKLGKYSAKLIYKSTNNCIDSVFIDDVVTIDSLQNVTFSLSDTIVCAGAVITGSIRFEPKGIEPKINWTLNHSSNASTNIIGTPIIGQANEFILKTEKTGIYNMTVEVDAGKGCSNTLTKSNFVKVSGLTTAISADATTGCLPFSTVLRAQVLKNEYYKDPTNNSLKYLWQIDPNSDTKLKEPTKNFTNVSINKIGNYNIRLDVTNSDGCSETIIKRDVFNFDFKSHFEIDSITCEGITLQATNTTIGDNKYSWFSSNGSVNFISNTNAKNPYFKFKTPGLHQIYLVAEAPSGCTDTFYKTIDVRPFKFDFTVKDNQPKCTPAQYSFLVSRTNVDSFTWNFGDGNTIVSDQSGIAHIYDLGKVRPFRNEFDIELIASNNVGCRDTITKQKLIKVLGPNPTFAALNKIGCNPHLVEFVDSTEQVEKFYFNFNDGSPLDSVSFKNHLYTKNDTNKLYQVYKPYIIASDKNKCFVSYQPEDSIVVYELPKVRFNTNSNYGCAPYTVSFNNNSKYGVKYYWDFENDGVIDDTTKNPVHTFGPGTFSVKLIAENKIGCKDSLILSRLIRVTEPPTAIFTVSDTLLCPNKPINFNDLSTGKYNIQSRKWYFEGDSNGDSSTQQFTIYNYADTGLYTIKLIVTDVNNCTDTLIKPNIISILDSLPVNKPKIQYLTVSENIGVKLFFNPAKEIGFKENQIFKNGNINSPVWASGTASKNNVFLNDLDVNTTTVGYQLRLIDACEVPDRISNMHKSIYLNVSRNDKPYARISWTPYVGWDTLNQYYIYRSTTGGTYKRIATIPATDTFFVDVKVCDNEYTYLVAAEHPTLGYTSYSNSFNFNPYYKIPKDTLVVELVTVSKGKAWVYWFNNSNLGVKEYFIDRYDEYTGWVGEVHSTNDTFFSDSTVEIQNFSYKYRVWYRDFCNERNPSGNHGSTLHLQAELVNNSDFVYTWNSYQNWINGINNYIIETASHKDSAYTKLAEVNALDTQYIHKNKALNSDSSFYVRVKAIRNNFSDTSVSNAIQVQPLPNIFIPNAFSPNGDGVNDFFKLDGIGFQRSDTSQFSISIYNRWGQMVYSSNTYGQFWDGKFNQEQCPSDIYRYVIYIKGINNMKYYFDGNIHILY